MSVRRSARVKALAPVQNAPVTLKQSFRTAKSQSSKRSSKHISSESSAKENGDVKKKCLKQVANSPKSKRTRLDTQSSAVDIITSPAPTPLPVCHTTGDTGDAVPSSTRPAEPHVTNAPVEAPEDSHVVNAYSNFESPVPSTTATTLPPPTATTSTLLDKAIAHLIAVDPTGKLMAVVEKHPCHIFSPDGLAEVINPFRSLASGIMAQQVSGAAASSIKSKFIGLFPPSATHPGPPHFPSPALVASSPIATLRTAGLSQRKAEYIHGMAEKFVSGELSAEMLVQASDEEVMEKLVAVRGLGRWSVEMFACFSLKRMDVFSTGDLGVQ